MKKLLLSIILIFSNSGIAQIFESDNIQEIRSKFLELQNKYKPNQIIGIFGIKNTLIYAQDAALNITNDNIKSLMKKVFSQLKSENSIYLNEIILTSYKHLLVDSEIPNLIKEVISSGTPMLAVNTTLTGNINQIPRIETWLAEYLKKFNVDFSKSFSGNRDFNLANMKQFKGSYPNFYQGILSTNSKFTNAQTFIKFLILAQFKPQVVIMIDQDINALIGMEQQLKSFNKDIIFIGYHYNAIKNIKFREVDDQDFINFWYGLVDKVNKAKRTIDSTNSKSKSDPYDQ